MATGVSSAGCRATDNDEERRQRMEFLIVTLIAVAVVAADIALLHRGAL